MSAKQIKLPNNGLTVTERILGRRLSDPVPNCRLVRCCDKMSTWDEWQQVPDLACPKLQKTKQVG